MESQMNLPSHHDETKKESTEFEKNQKRYQEIIATFPHTKGWFPKAQLIEYGGHWMSQPHLEGCLYAQEFFQARSIDFFICSYPKTGTTWLKALTFAIVNRSRFDDSSNPLLKRNPHELFPFIEIEFSLFPKVKALKDKGNTLFATHIPYGLLPKSVAKAGCKMVYIWRDPKDTFISMWTFLQKQRLDYGPLTTLEESFDMFCRGASVYGHYLDHVLGYWKAYQENPKHILFLKYEAMKSNPLPYVKRLAQFMGYGFAAEEVKKGVVVKIVNMSSFETLKNLEVNEGEKIREDVPQVRWSNSAYFRKGKVGDWQDYLTPDMAARIDALMHEKFIRALVCLNMTNYDRVVFRAMTHLVICVKLLLARINLVSVLSKCILVRINKRIVFVTKEPLFSYLNVYAVSIELNKYMISLRPQNTPGDYGKKLKT